jgi:hypothetical protein
MVKLLVLVVLVVVIFAVKALTLVAPDSVTNFFLLAFTLVFADITFLPPALPFVLSFIRPASFLSAILAIVGTGVCS